MQILTREIPDNVSLLLFGDEEWRDTETIARTLRMTLTYQNIFVHFVSKHAFDKSAVKTCIDFLELQPHRSLQLVGHTNIAEAVHSALELGGRNCRVVCRAYCNGTDMITLAGIHMALQVGIETGAIPHDRNLKS